LALPGRAHAQLYVTQVELGIVSEYDATTGALINANFITGLSDPHALLLSGNNLYVTNAGPTGSVGLYDAKTGAVINASFLTATDFHPTGLAFSGGDFYAANPVASEVYKFNARGVWVHSYGESTGDTDSDIEFFSKGVYFLSDETISQVSEINAKTGVVLNSATYTGAYGLALLGDTLFVGSLDFNEIGEFDAETLELIKGNFITGLNNPCQIVLVGDTLFVVNNGNGTVGEYDANTGAVINASFISGLSSPFGIAVKVKK
jgi:DNA-binding beta-propeller fold protein YncE